MTNFIVRLKHDKGFVSVTVAAETTEQAIQLVCEMEKAPLNAVRSVKKGDTKWN